MRCLVCAGMYRASGALFNTIETVAVENPLSPATSRIVAFPFGFFARDELPRAPFCESAARAARFVSGFDAPSLADFRLAFIQIPILRTADRCWLLLISTRLTI